MKYFVTMTVAVLVLAAVAYAAPPHPGDQLNAAFDQLQAQLDNHEARLSKLEAAVTTTVTTPPPPANTISQNITSGQTLFGNVKWTASTSGPASAASVHFFIDGSDNWVERIAPYQFNGDPDGTLATDSLTNGTHTLRVQSWSSSNTVIASAQVDVAVVNGGSGG